MSNCSIELLSVAVVREYLSRKGYKSTLTAFDDESKKKNQSLQNRRKLAEELKILDLLKENKRSSEERLNCFLEIIVKHLKEERNGESCFRSAHVDLSGYILKQDDSVSHVILSKTNLENEPPIGQNPDNTIHCSSCRCNNNKKTNHRNGIVGRRRRRKSNKELSNENDAPKIPTSSLEVKESSSFKIVHSASFIEELRKKKEQNNSPKSNIETIIAEDHTGTVSSSKDKTENDKQKKPPANLFKKPNAADCNNLIIDDFELEDTNEDVFSLYTQTKVSRELHVRVEGITMKTAAQLKIIIFGSASRSFNTEWMKQGFYFSKHPLLSYGLMQDKGGPCGLLAAVQSWILKFLLVNDQNKMKNAVPTPTQEEQMSALVDALSHILWLVHYKDEVVVTLSSKQSKFIGSEQYNADNLTEKLDLYILNSRTKLRAFLERNISTFCGEHGLVLFLYSAILSCGLDCLRNNMDDVNGMLLGCHGYCTQEMVNLLLTGRSVSNVFDGKMTFGCGQEKTTLCGIEKQSDIGFLSLFEHYDSCEVGTNYKNPKYPIWVVCSESHFSVLFAIYDIITKKTKHNEFDLYYFDGLGKQDEEIKLSIILPESKSHKPEPRNYPHGLVPPLDHCIRTKWKNTNICWNDTEPLL